MGGEAQVRLLFERSGIELTRRLRSLFLKFSGTEGQIKSDVERTRAFSSPLSSRGGED